MSTQWGALAGSLLDLSATGAQVRLATGLVPPEGDEVVIRLVDGRHISGSVTWTRRDAIGIRFERTLPAVEDLLWLELRGPDWFHTSVRAQR